MYGRRQVHHAQVGEDRDLRVRLAHVTPDTQRNVVERDAHLIEAAIATDRSVASGDERARSLFRDASKYLLELKQIVWVNPTDGGTNVLAWLRQGAPKTPHLQFGAG